MDYQDTLNALKNGNIPRESILDFSVGFFQCLTIQRVLFKTPPKFFIELIWII